MALWKNKSAEALLCPCCEVLSLCQSHCFVVIPERGLAMHVECKERGKKTYVRWMWSVRHAWPHTRMIFQEDAFSPRLLYIITHDKNEDVRKRNMDRFDQWFYGYFFFYWMCTCMPCMNGKRKLELLCMVAWETSPIKCIHTFEGIESLVFLFLSTKTRQSRSSKCPRIRMS